MSLLIQLTFLSIFNRLVHDSNILPPTNELYQQKKKKKKSRDVTSYTKWGA